jgi:hypothetical protein
MPRVFPLPLLLTLLLAPVAGAEEESTAEKPSTGVSMGFGIDFFKLETSDEEFRLKILDLGLLSLYDQERSDPDRSRLEILRLPFIDTFSRERDGEARALSILDIPFFTLFRREQGEAGARDLRFLKLPLIGSLYADHRDEDGAERQILYLIRYKTVHGPDLDVD